MKFLYTRSSHQPQWVYWCLYILSGWLLFSSAWSTGTGIITTVAGNGTSGYNGDGGLAINARITAPQDVALDSAGNIYIPDIDNHRIRKVDITSGTISTIAGSGVQGFSGDGGSAINAKLNQPHSISIDTSNNIYFIDISNNRIRKINNNTGTITTVVGNGTAGFSGDGFSASTAKISAPNGIDLDINGNLYIADTGNHRIRKVDLITKTISTIVGTGTGGYNGDGLTATNTQLQFPVDVAVDNSGNIYIADGTNRIRKVNVSTNKVTTVAGTGVESFSGDGSAANLAGVKIPKGVTLDRNDNLYITDTGNQRIRKIDAATGKIDTIVGTGSIGYAGDGSAALTAKLQSPHAVALDSIGNLYIADSCHVPWDHIPSRSYPLFKARAILEGILSTHGYKAKRT